VISVEHGDCLDVLASWPPAIIDACVTDPPYHLTEIKTSAQSFGSQLAHGRTTEQRAARTGFMGKSWDGGSIAFDPDTWRAVFRVLKPGAHLLAFGGTRTSHRMTCAIEDAGFEIRDTLCWLYGSGFPKSHNLDGDWQGWGTALKPAHEPIILARKPLIGTVAANVLAHGTGAINVDACRVVGDKSQRGERLTALGRMNDDGWTPRATQAADTLGRWPANVVHDGSPEVEAAFAAFGDDHASKFTPASERRNRQQAFGMTEGVGYGDTGTASRFFYTAKADRADRADSKHPTVKPVDLMRWLVRMVTPPGGTVLDPFAGSGTTGEAAMLEVFNALLIERDATHAADIRHRIKRWSGLDAPLFAEAAPCP